MKPARPSIAARLATLPVRFYRRFLSPLKPPSCRFHPTCSAYAEEALGLHGLWRGGRLAAWRILRCQPLCKGGLDPVPGSDLERAARACAQGVDVDTARCTTPPGDPAEQPSAPFR